MNNQNKKFDNLEIKNNKKFKNIESEEEDEKEHDNIINDKHWQEKIKNKIYYLEFNNEKKEYYKYSFSKANWKTLTVNYKCSDSSCSWRLTAKIEILKEYNNININSFDIKKQHNINNNEHNYHYNAQILEDYKYKGTIFVNKKCSNPIYFKKFLIITSISNNKYNLKGKEMLSNFIEKYGDITFKIDELSEPYKEYIIDK